MANPGRIRRHFRLYQTSSTELSSCAGPGPIHNFRGYLDFAFETTLAGRAYAHRLRTLRATGYAVFVVFLWLPSPELAIARVADRVRRGGHDVPAELIRRRYHRGLRNFFGLYRPFADGWRVYDSSRQTPALIAAGHNGEIDRLEDEGTWNAVLETAGEGAR